MKSKIFERIRKKTKLSNKLQVLNEMAFIDLLTVLGYRKDKMWTPDEDEILQKLIDYAKKHTKHQLDEIKEHMIEKLELNEKQIEILSKTT